MTKATESLSSSSAGARQATLARPAADRDFFLSLIAAATAIPIVFVAYAAPMRAAASSIDDVFRLLLIMSTMHVGLTAYFYIDGEYRAHIAKHSGFYVWLPASVILAAGTVTATFAAAGVVYLQLFYHAWLLFHYGRQNYGVLAFAAAATESGRPTAFERWSLHLAPAGGILGAHKVFGPFNDTAFAPFVDWSFQIGVGLSIAAVCLAVAAAARHIAGARPFWRPFMIVLLSLFYLPTFFFDNYMQAVTGYAIAHALQYFVFMFFLAAGSARVSPGRAISALALGALAVWGLILLLTREKSIWGPALPFVTGAAIGLIMWHFIVDAGLWRLSRQWQRDRVRQRFAFLFPN